MRPYRARCHSLCAGALLAVLALAAAPGPARAGGEVVVVRSTDLPAYRGVEQAFLAAMGSSARGVQLAPGNLAEQIRVTTNGAKLLFAIGPDVAVAAAAQGKGVAVLHAFVPNPSAIGLDPTLPSVSTTVSPGYHVRALRTVLPHARRVGIIYDPGQSGPLVGDCESALLGAGLTLVRKEVTARADVAAALRQLLPRVDVLWIVPDATVVGMETLRLLVHAPLEARMPVIAYGENLARAGALIAFEARYDDVGRKAAAAAKRLLAGGKVSVATPQGVLYLNGKTAEALGVTLSPALRAQAGKVFE